MRGINHFGIKKSRKYLVLGLFALLSACDCEPGTATCDGQVIKVCVEDGPDLVFSAVRDCADYDAVCKVGQSGDLYMDKHHDGIEVACTLPECDCSEEGVETCSEYEEYTVECAQNSNGPYGVITEYRIETYNNYGQYLEFCRERPEIGTAGYSAIDIPCEGGDTHCDGSITAYWSCVWGYWTNYTRCDTSSGSYCEQLSETVAECS